VISNRRFVPFLALTGILACQPIASGQATKQSDIKALIQKLIDADDVERPLVMEQLDQIKDPNALVPPLLAALEVVDPKEAWKLLDVLARFPGAVKPAPLLRLARRTAAGNLNMLQQPQLSAQLLAAGSSVREEIVKAISDACVTWTPNGEDGPSSSDEKTTESPDQAINLQAFLDWAAKTLAATGPQGVDELLQMLGGHDACRRQAAQDGISQYLLEDEELELKPVMRRLTEDLANADPGVQKAAMSVIEPIIGFHRAPFSAELIKPLFVILKNNPDAEARSTAFRLLCRGSASTRKKAAEIASHDSNEELQNVALELLEQIAEPSQPSRP